MKETITIYWVSQDKQRTKVLVIKPSARMAKTYELKNVSSVCWIWQLKYQLFIYQLIVNF